MRKREVQRLARMVVSPPRVAPRWLTPKMVKQATPLNGLDDVARGRVRTTRILLLCAVARKGADELRRTASGSNSSEGEEA